MNKINQRILEWFDRLAEITGVPALDRRMRQGLESEAFRPFRIVSGILLLAVIIALILAMAGPLAGSLGWMLISFCFIASGIIRMFSPMRAFGRPRDEYERSVQQVGRVWGLASVTIMCVSGCFWFSLVAVAEAQGVSLWMPRGYMEWFCVGLALIVIEMNVSVLAASWVLPRSLPEQD